MENFKYLPENVRRAIEVSKIASFTFNLIDLSENRYFKGLISDYKNELPFPSIDTLNYIQDSQPNISYLSGNGMESWETVEKRIKKSKEKVRNDIDLFADIRKDESSYSMLKKAYKVFNASFIEVQNCLKLSEAIRAEMGTKGIKSNHVAEAIQYAFQRGDEK